MGRSTMPGDCHQRAVVLIGWWMVLATPFVGGTAAAQVSPYLSNNPSVIVDTEVLESLGGAPLIGVGTIAASPRPKVDAQGLATAPRRSQATLPSPAVAPRSRLNEDALARLGLTRIPPPAANKQTAAKLAAAPAPKPRTAAVDTPAPAVSPKSPSTPAVATPAVRQAAKVPARPVLPVVKAPAPAPVVTRQTTSVAPPPPPPPAPATAPASQTTTIKAAPRPAVTAALAPPKQAAADRRGDDDGLRLLFDNGSAKLSDDARSNLQSLTAKLGADETLQVQLVAYAAGTAETSSQARRLSLSRALAVRSFLIDKGVRSTRMDIRALGNKAKDGPADRVDVVLVQK